MTDPDLEAVARAICVAQGLDPHLEDKLCVGPTWRLFRKHAQAALDALRPRLSVADKAVAFVNAVTTEADLSYADLEDAVRALDPPATPGAAETEGRKG